MLMFADFVLMKTGVRGVVTVLVSVLVTVSV